MEKSRIAALADGIFAVAMTLLVLDLKLPEGAKTTTDAEVWQQLVELRGHFLIYALSFTVLGAYWVDHHHQFHFVRRVNWGLLWLNLLFLLFIALVPFSTNLLAGRSRLHLPVAIYGLNLLLLSLVFLWHLRYLTRHPELAHDALTPARAAEVRRPSALVEFVAAASIVISFYKPSLALAAYWLLLAFHLLRARADRYPAADGEETQETQPLVGAGAQPRPFTGPLSIHGGPAPKLGAVQGFAEGDHRRDNLSSGASKRFPSGNRKIPNFSGYKAASSTRNPGKFTKIIDPKQGDYACQQGEKRMVLATFSVQIARFSRESRFFARKLG